MKITPFDRLVLLVAALLVAATGITMLIGDNVGVRLLRLGPVDVARQTSPITIEFSEPMDRASVLERLRTEPTIDGEARWSGNRLLFSPSPGLVPGQTYTVTLAEGARSTTGRSVLDQHTFSFTVRGPRVAYLATAGGAPRNIWITDPADPSRPEQLTHLTTGVNSFDVSPDGRRIVYSASGPDLNSEDLWVIDLETRDITQATDLRGGIASHPVWSPDGQRIAYERVDSDIGVPGVTMTGFRTPRIWLIDMGVTPPETERLFSDSQVAGYSPLWSPDGGRLALGTDSFEASNRGILVYDMADGSTQFFDALYNAAETFSPDGSSLAFPVERLVDGLVQTEVWLADLDAGETRQITESEQPGLDIKLAWSPDGQWIATARRSLNDTGIAGHQIHLINPQNGVVEPIVVSREYDNGPIAWSHDARHLAIGRVHRWAATGERNPDVRQEVWTYDMESGELSMIAVDASQPRWVP